MSEPSLETLSAIEIAARRYIAGYPPPQVPPRRFQATAAQLAKLTAELASVPEIAGVQGRQFSTAGLIAPLDLSFLAGALVERVIDGAPAANAFDDLMDLLRRKKAPIYHLKGIVGVGVSSVVELSDNVAVMPAAKAPPSKAREEIFQLDRSGHRIV